MAISVTPHAIQLEKNIHAQFEQLSQRLKQVAQYVVLNKHSVAFNTISVIADEVNVPPSTLIRFAQALGYKGFNDIKQIYKTELLNTESNYHNRAKLLKHDHPKHHLECPTPQRILSEIAQACNQSLCHLEQAILADDMSQAVSLMNQAKRIYIIGLGRSFGIASYLSYMLCHLRIPTYLVHKMGDTLKEQVSMMENGDLLIAISFSPYSEDTVTACNAAHINGGKLLVISDENLNPVANHADVCLVVKETKFRDAFRTLSASSSLVQALCISLIYERS